MFEIECKKVVVKNLKSFHVDQPLFSSWDNSHVFKEDRTTQQPIFAKIIQQKYVCSLKQDLGNIKHVFK